MSDLDLQRLALFPATPLVALIVGVGIAASLLARKPGREEGGAGEGCLGIADDLGGA